MKVYFLSDHFPWFGEHQCYDRLPFFIQKSGSEIHIVDTQDRFSQRLIGKFYSIAQGWQWRKDSIRAASELRFSRLFKEKNSIYHILFFDLHYYLLQKWEKAPTNIIGTIHHPIGRKFPPLMEENLKRLSSAIVLYQDGVEFFEKYIGRNRIKFIPYGVDIDFFYPAYQESCMSKRILFAGHNGRNTSMLYRVVRRLAKIYPEWTFDLLVPEQHRGLDGLHQLLNHPSVRWHQRIPEETVRDLYQKNYLLLMPMDDSGVNTAIVEALACGLPIVTTDVGGIRDYGGGAIYPVVANNDDGAMVEVVEKYLAKPDWRDEIARKCREFAEQNLAWPLIAQKHIGAYKELVEQI
ncbi:MAG: glycosyltransferase family 4 protein [Candidatus Omnitrophota bacterium]|nr:MAG: glycosyltransferase family 4 protein [Candidatus Omnitrophota bacterium]